MLTSFSILYRKDGEIILSDSINILIRAILEKTTKTQLEAELKNIEKKLKPLEVKTNLAGGNTSKVYKELGEESRKLVEHSRTVTDNLGRQYIITRKFNEEQNKYITTSIKKLTNEQKVTDQFYKQGIAQKSLLADLNKMYSMDYKVLEKKGLLGQYQELKTAIEKLDPTNKNFNKQLAEQKLNFKNLGTSVSVVKKEIRDANKYTGIFGQSLFEAGKKFAGWLFMGNIIMGAIKSVRFGINTIVELDKEMVSLRKVTSATEEEYKQFYITSGEVSKQLGKTKQEVINSSAEFARLGFNIKESITLANEALMLSNVGEVPIESATSSLISTIKGFGIEVDEQGKNIRKIVDVYNEVANNFAISQEGISEAIRRSASSLHNAGNTLEESVAMITAANAVVQDPAVVGTALKTVTMRLRGITDEGEEVQNLLPKLESEFRKLGITVRENEDTFKSTYDIFDNLAAKWDELTDLQRANILELVAGKRQGNVVASMLNNWEDAQNSLTTAILSGGSAMREFIKYQDSIEYKSGVLKSTLTNFWSEALSTGAFKSFYDTAIMAIEGLDVLINKTEYLSSVVLPLLVGVIFARVIPALHASISKIIEAGLSMAALQASINPILAVLTVATIGFGAYSYAVAKAKHEKEAFIKTSENNLHLAEAEGKSAKFLSEQYEKLKDKVGETEEGKKRLDTIISHLIKINPDLEKGIDGQRIGYGNLAEAIQITIDKMDELARKSKEAIRASYAEDYLKLKEEQRMLENAIKIQEGDNYLGTSITGGAATSKRKQRLKEIESESREIARKINALFTNTPSSGTPTPDPDPWTPPSGGSGGDTPPTPKIFNLYETALAQINHDIEKLQHELETDPSKAIELRLKLNTKKDLINRELIDVTEQLQSAYNQLAQTDKGKEYALMIKSGFDVKDITVTDEKLANLIENTIKLRDAQFKLGNELRNVNKEFTNISTTLDKLIDTQIKTVTDSVSKQIKSLQDEQDAIIEVMQDSLDEYERKQEKKIERLKEELELLEEQYEVEDRLKKLQELNDEIAKVRADTRFEYINQFGEIEYTYNKEKYNELVKQREELLAEYKRKDIIKAKKDEIKALEDATKKEIQRQKDEIEATKKSYDTRIEDYQSFKDVLSEMQNMELAELQTHISAKIAELKRYEEAARRHQQAISSIQSSVVSSIPANFYEGMTPAQIEHANQLLGIHHTGLDAGLVGGKTPTPKEEVVIKAMKGELLANREQIPKIIPNILNTFIPKIPQFTTMNRSIGGTQTNYYLSNFTIKSDNAMDLFKQINHLAIAHTGS